MKPHLRRLSGWRAAAMALLLGGLQALWTQGPALAAPTPRDALIVLEKREQTLAIVDPATGQVVARVPAGGDPHEVVVSQDGQRAYISNYGGLGSQLHTISVVDLVLQKDLAPVDLGPLRSAHGLDLVDGKLYFTAETAKAIGRYDPGRNAIDWVLGLGLGRTHMIKVSPSQSRIFTTNVWSGSASIIDRRPVFDDWTLTEIKTGRGAEGFDVSPDGKFLWVANAQDGTVSIIDTALKQVVQTLTLPWKSGNRLKFTSDGRSVLISSDQLVMVDAETKAIRTLKVGNSGGAGILMSPDGRTAYLALPQENRIAVIDLGGFVVTRWIATGGIPDGMAWARR